MKKFFILFQLIFWIAQLEILVTDERFTAELAKKINALGQLFALRFRLSLLLNSTYKTMLEGSILLLGSKIYAPIVYRSTTVEPLDLSVRQ